MASTEWNAGAISGVVAVRWPEQYLALPYKRLGRGKAGVDCWGLVCLIYSERGGPELPAHGEIDPTDLPSILQLIREGRRAGPWRQVRPGQDRALDLVLLNRVINGQLMPTHVGIVTIPGHLIHIEPQGAAHLAFRNGLTFRADPSVGPYVEAIYRHEAMA